VYVEKLLKNTRLFAVNKRRRRRSSFLSSNLPNIMEKTLQSTHCPTFTGHLKKLQPNRQDRIAQKNEKQKSSFLPSKTSTHL
jgi:hypothetical protein